MAIPAASGSVSGIVVDANNLPIKGALVTVVPFGLFDLSGARLQSVTSNASGQFRFPATPVGSYAITVTVEGLEAARLDAATDDRPVRLQLGKGGRVLFGRVVDRQQVAQGNAEVRLAHGLGGAGDVFVVRSNVDGDWSASVPNGDYMIQAEIPGHESAARMSHQGRHPTILIVEPRSLPEPPPRSVVDWLRSASIPLASVEPETGNGDLAPIGAIVGEAPVVGLGEATHGTREIFKLKHRLVEYLVRDLGFTVFAIEFSLAESIAIDNYVMGRGGDPETMLAAQSAAVWQAQELLDLIRWMKNWNQTHERKVRFHGVDMRLGGRAAEGVLSYLGSVDRAALSSPAVQALAPLANPATYRKTLRGSVSELDTLGLRAREISDRLNDRKADYIERSSLGDWWRAEAQARALAQMLEWRAASSQLSKVQVRERAMADNALALLEHYGAGARMIYWAHNAHVAGDAGAEPQMAGVHLRQRLGDRYRAFGTTLYQGAYQAADASGGLRHFEVPPAPVGSIEDAFAATNLPIAALDIRRLPASGEVADWFGALRGMRQYDGLYDDQRPVGWANAVQPVARNYDALLFLAEGSSATPLTSAVANPP